MFTHRRVEGRRSCYNRGNMLDGIIGHERIVETLRRQAERGQLAHAYLFIGQEGVGKTAVALGLIGNGGEFQWVARLEDEKSGKLKSAISVDQIRDLRDRLSLTSFSGETKAAFIEEADRLSDGAANALLKTLEEPRGDTVIVLRAETLESVSQTIASRCQVIRFCPVPAAVISTALVKRGVAKDEAAELAAASRGRPGVALRLLTDRAYRAERDTAAASFGAMMASALPKRLGIVAELLPKSEEDKRRAVERILDVWEEAARETLLAGDARAPAVLDRLREAREAVGRNVSPQLALEHIVI